MTNPLRPVIDVDAMVAALQATLTSQSRRSVGEVRWDVLRLLAEYDRQTGSRLASPAAPSPDWDAIDKWLDEP